MFLSVMVAIGLFVFRLLIARPVAGASPEASLRSVTIAFVVALDRRPDRDPGLPRPVDRRSTRCARSFAVGALVPLFRVTAFGRGYVDLEICFALFCVAAGSRSGSTGPSASSGRSPSSSRPLGRARRGGRRCS